MGIGYPLPVVGRSLLLLHQHMRGWDHEPLSYRLQYVAHVVGSVAVAYRVHTVCVGGATGGTIYTCDVCSLRPLQLCMNFGSAMFV